MTRDAVIGEEFSMTPDEMREQIARLEKRLQLVLEDQRRQERINDNHRNLLYKVNLEYESLLEKHQQLAGELHYKNLHLSGILENAPYTLFTLDPEMRLKTANPRALEFFRTGDNSTFAGKRLSELVQPDLAEGIDSFAGYSIRESRAVAFDAALGREGAERMLEVTLFPLPRQGEAGADVCCIVRDQTLAREELADQIMQGQLFEYRALTASFVHEINNPLNGIINYLELAMEGERDEKKRSWLAESVHLAERVSHIAASMRESAGGTKGNADAPFELAASVSDALLLLRHEMKLRQVGLDLDISKIDEPCFGNQVEVIQIVQNLVLNAIQAFDGLPADSQEKRPPMIAIGCRYDKDRSEFILKVADNGPGIDSEILTRIFHPFFTTKGFGKGTGLGLYICRKLAKKQGGALEVETSPQGSVFTLRLPRRTDEPAL